jgi:hypothetical protein
LSYIPRTRSGRGSETVFGKLDFNGFVIAMSRNLGGAKHTPKRTGERAITLLGIHPDAGLV